MTEIEYQNASAQPRDVVSRHMVGTFVMEEEGNGVPAMSKNPTGDR